MKDLIVMRRLSLKPLVALPIVALIFAVPIHAGQSRAIRRSDAQRKSKLRRAEAAANEIVHRFHETLDFKSTFANDFVTEPKLRERAVAFGDLAGRTRFDTATNERVYVVAMTCVHLWAEYMLIQSDSEVPPEVQKLRPKLKLINDSTENQPRNLLELNEAIEEAEQVSTIYRKYLSRTAFHGTIYSENIRRERERAKVYFHNIPRLERGNKRFGIPETISVYVVRPEVFDYYFIEERGVMKLFNVDILPNFKLF
jgi:hypothetical protein